MKVIIPFLVCLALHMVLPATAQITPAEYQKMWAANTVAYNAQTAEADKKKADGIITAMEKKYPADASVMLNRGVYFYWFFNDDNKALTHFSKAIQKKPNYNLAYMYRAKVLARKGVYEKAIADLTIVLQTDSLNIEALKERGDYAFTVKQYDSALIDYQKLMRLKPNNPVAENDVALTLVAVGKISLAEAIYTNSLKVPNVDSARVCANYGKFLLGQKRYPSALDNFEKAIRIAPQILTADDYNGAGIAAYKEKKYVFARKFFKAAITTEPGNLNYYDNLANVGIDENDFALVIDNAMRMMEIDANNAKANMLLYMGLFKSGRNETIAVTYRDRAFELDKEGRTTLALPDSILFVLPKNEADRRVQQNSPTYAAALLNYKTNFVSIPESTWNLAFKEELKDGDKPLKLAKSGEVFVVQIDNKLQISHNGKDAVSAHFPAGGFEKKNNDILLSTDFTIGPNDGSGAAGIMVATTGNNPINYYFMVNPIKKGMFIGFKQNGKIWAYHSMNDSVAGKLPEVNEPINMQVISKNLDLAFVVNGQVLSIMPLIKFRNINSLQQVALQVEGNVKVNLTGLRAGYSINNMTASAIDALGWQREELAAIEAAKPKPVPSLPFLGTFIVYSSYSGVNFPYLFHIKGNGPIDEQRMFNLLVKTLYKGGTFKNYTWKPNQEMSQITKGWDLRDYKYSGTYDTNGNYLYY